MVLEQLIKVQWIERKEHAFFLGFFYNIIGLISAMLIFPQSTGIMSVAFTSILLIPSLAQLLKLEENVEIREKKLSFKLLMKDHKDIFKVYLFLFVGIFLSYAIIGLFFPEPLLYERFATQFQTAGITGRAAHQGLFYGIILNNLLVLLVCFILSLIYGAGSVLFLTWNASVWGVVFAYFVRELSARGSQGVVITFMASVLPFLPHMITEAFAYISASIVGGVVSKAVLREKLHSPGFHHIITDAMLLMGLGLLTVIVGGILEVFIFPLFF